MALSLVCVSEQLSADQVMCFGMALFGLGGFMFVSVPQDDLSLPEKCKVMSCDFTCPAVIYLTPVSARFCLAPSYQFAIDQGETGENEH